MIKVLHITSNYNDYAALDYEEAERNEVINPERLWDEAWTIAMPLEYRDDKYQFEYRASRFENIDPLFVHFIRDEILDYDNSKHNNFYVIGESCKPMKS